MSTPPYVLKKTHKNGTFTIKKNGAAGLKFDMQTQLDSANNMGWVPSGHTSSSLCVRLNMPKMVFLKKNGPNHMLTFVMKIYNTNLQSRYFCDYSPLK